MLEFQRRTSRMRWASSLPFFFSSAVEVVAEHRVLQRGDELGIVVVVAEIAVAVRIGPDADLAFPEAVGRAVLAHLADRDLAGAVGMHVVGLRLRRLDRGAVGEQRMRGVAQVLEIELPVAVIGVPEHAAGHLDLAVRRAVDHVVERRRHVAERFFQVRPVGRFAREDKAAIALHPRAPTASTCSDSPTLKSRG